MHLFHSCMINADEVIRTDPNSWQMSINTAVPLFDYYIESLALSENLNDNQVKENIAIKAGFLIIDLIHDFEFPRFAIIVGPKLKTDNLVKDVCNRLSEDPVVSVAKSVFIIFGITSEKSRSRKLYITSSRKVT